MGDSDSPPAVPLRFGRPSTRRYRRASRRDRRRRGLLRSWGTSERAPRSQTPVGPLRLAIEDDLRCGELPLSGGFRLLSLPVPQSSPSSLSLRLGGAPVLPAHIAKRRLPTTIFLSKLNHAAHALAVYASQLSFPLPRSYSHARLASGWWPASTGRGSIPRKVPNEVSASSTWLPPHPSFRSASNVLVGHAGAFTSPSNTAARRDLPPHGTPRNRHPTGLHDTTASHRPLERIPGRRAPPLPHQTTRPESTSPTRSYATQQNSRRTPPRTTLA